MPTSQRQTWKEFRESLHNFAKLDRQRRNQLWFRGQGNSAWPLLTTLDRHRTFADDHERADYVERLLTEFRCEAIRLGYPELPVGPPGELLARHHGLPSPLMDWTTSPWVAAYFAFLDSSGAAGETVAIWTLDRAKISPTLNVELIDDQELIRVNRRALHQRGVFLRVATSSQPIADLLDNALFRFDLPAEERDVALNDLDQMTISATTLLNDLDGAARTAMARVRAN
jgi:hypothetical protein